MSELRRLRSGLGRIRAEWYIDTVGEASSALAYRGPADFILRHGRLYWPELISTRATGSQACFVNAIFGAVAKGGSYVEGFALGGPRSAQRPVHHAWVALPDGTSLEGTWNHLGGAYLGVEFSLERADDAMWNGDACVLDDRHRGWPVLRQGWAGEDPSIEWPPSYRLEFFRKLAAGEATAEEYEAVQTRMVAEAKATPAERDAARPEILARWGARDLDDFLPKVLHREP